MSVLDTLIERRRDRAIGAILGVKEREVDEFLPDAVRRRLRKVVLDQLNDYTALVLDVMGPLQDDTDIVLNDMWLDKIEQIHAAVCRNGSGP